MRIVLDTNVLLAGLLTRGVCEALLELCLESDACVIVLSEHILREFERHATGKFGAPPADVAEAISLLREHAELVEPEAMRDIACRDADDLPVLGTATAGRADVLVTGDSDLLELRSVRGIAILTPRQFYERLV